MDRLPKAREIHPVSRHDIPLAPAPPKWGAHADADAAGYNIGQASVVARRGVSVRNGYWDEDKQVFVEQDPDVMSDYTYMLALDVAVQRQGMDHMSNVVGLNDAASGTGALQRFDAFGNNLGGYVTFQCASDHDNADLYASVPAEPVERMHTGQFNWRGGEGSATDWISEDALDAGAPQAVRNWAYTTPSTGLVYINARYYDPAVGRFTQADPLPYGPDMLWGQNNRWTYCANDPVNASDPTGMNPVVVFVAVILAIALISGLTSAAGGGSFWAGAAGGTLAGLGTAAAVVCPGSLPAAIALVLGNGAGAGLTSGLNGNAFDEVMFDFAVGTLFSGLGLYAGGADFGDLLAFLIGFDAQCTANCVRGLRNAW